MTDKEVIEDEKCNFREILNKWKTYNREPTALGSNNKARRCVSAGQPSSSSVLSSLPTAFPQRPKVRTSVKQLNPHFVSLDPTELVQSADSQSLDTQGFIGRAVLRTVYGESKIAETYYSIKLHPKATPLAFRKARISAYSNYYRDCNGDIFNFDALIYDLARLYALAKTFNRHEEATNLRVNRKKFPEALPQPNSKPSHDCIWIPEVKQNTNLFPFIPDSPVLVDFLCLFERQGTKVVIRRTEVPETSGSVSSEQKKSKAEVKNEPTISDGIFLQRLAAIYTEADKFPEFCFAYLAGIFSVVEIGKATPEGGFFADVLRKTEFPQPVGNLGPLIDCSQSTNALSSKFNFNPLTDALRAAAMVSVSDPGSPYTREWQPVISHATQPEKHLVNILENAREFFECWLQNFSYLMLPTTHRLKNATACPLTVNSALTSNFLNALRHVDAEYLSLDTIAPWFAVEPTHLLNKCDIKYTYGGTMPLGNADMSVTTVPCLSSLHKIKRYDDIFELSLNWHSLRKNLLIWILGDSVNVNTDEMLDIRDSSYTSSLPSPLRILNAESTEPGIIGVNNDRSNGTLDRLKRHDTIDLIVWPLEKHNLGLETSRASIRKTKCAARFSNRETANSVEPSLIAFNGSIIAAKKGVKSTASFPTESETEEAGKTEVKAMEVKQSEIKKTKAEKTEAYSAELVRDEKPVEAKIMANQSDPQPAQQEKDQKSKSAIRIDLESGSELEYDGLNTSESASESNTPGSFSSPKEGSEEDSEKSSV